MTDKKQGDQPTVVADETLDEVAGGNAALFAVMNEAIKQATYNEVLTKVVKTRQDAATDFAHNSRP